ncbi:MAG: protein translocase subunit SecD, partial [Desulfobacterales bacterium]
MKNLSWRAVSVIAVIVIAIIYILPTIKPSLWPHKKINLGLDLQGGMHLALEVDTEKAVESTIERISQEMRSLLKKEHIRHTSLNRIDGSRISVAFRGQENIDKFEKLLDKEFKNLRILSRSTHDDIHSMML